MEYTPEQQRIVEHGDGHALVFAVAGSGKTTTLVGRVRHLVTQRGVRPVRILTTTFTREAGRSLREKLAEHPECAGVETLTLHALATRIVERARNMGLTDLVIGEEHFSQRLFSEARRQLLADLGEDEREVATRLRQMNFRDFDTYLGIQKGNLRLPHIPHDLPPGAAALISPPEGGPDLYARVYERHDELRRREGKLDFDDLIVAAWMLMSRFPILLQDIQSVWDYVSVDEFQDVNLAQSEMMHLVAFKCRSYMAIGDDDQTIYQWRGAHPRFILGFTERYGAREYTLPANFRCPLGVIALSDRVISRNRIRAPKRLRATREGGGVHLHPPRAGEAARVAMQALSEGREPDDIVILLRTYAQSAEIEQVLLEERVPYRLIGAAPFYRRAEVTTLTAYLELALADLDVLAGQLLTTERRERVQAHWKSVANRPSRYLRVPDIERVARDAWRGGQTLAATLEAFAAGQPPHVARPVTLLATWLGFLTEDMGTTPGRDALLDFVGAIGYRDHLISTAPTTEFGEERAGMVDALAEMAHTRSLGQLVTHLAQLHEQVRYEETLRRRSDREDPRLTIMTAFRAKGLEWPVVIIPDCTTAIYSTKPHPDPAASEEERRVFYVAMTRARQELHLIVGEADDTTRFLEDVEYDRVVGQHDRLAGLLERLPRTWSAGDTLEAAEVLGQYEHEAFVQRWLRPEVRRGVLGHIRGLAGHEKVRASDDEAARQVRGLLDLRRYAAHGPLEADDTGAHEWPDLDAVLAARRGGRLEPGPGSAPRGTPQGGVDALGRTVTPVPGRPLTPGTRVRHARFGDGEVVQVKQVGAQTEALIRFEGGTKRMALEFARLERLSN
ncbi:ATP-dependent helicase [Deinococcus aestuarii]|uniref:ATP-dependent helicase n=1 Tax=Deinococcus aestuarii TaxID=2774531 RepID=UPI001C0D4643|nr:ATP-dependent helicase [Deinococcus aestuarii]